MPMYEVEHICPLSEEQKDNLAEDITRIHSEMFTTPRLFVNVRFQDISEHLYYVGGKRRKINRITGIVRNGGNRTDSMWSDVMTAINKSWATHVGTKGDDELRAVFILGSMIAVTEAGFVGPKAGEDAAWLKKNIKPFQKLAQQGDADFKDLMDELTARNEFHGVLEDEGIAVNGHA